MKVVIVAENATINTGGESSLAYYYFKLIAEAGHDVTLLIHERTADNVRRELPSLAHKVLAVRDTRFQRLLDRIGQHLPSRIVEIIIDAPIYLSSQLRQRKVIRRLVDRDECEIVLHPSPIAPRAPSFIYGVGVPVIAGPLCGGMDLPPGFRNREGAGSRALMPLARAVALALSQIAPGRRRADLLLVAHNQTRAALPKRARGRVVEVPESGVDLEIWNGTRRSNPGQSGVSFVFLGQVRLWKGPDLLVRAFHQLVSRLAPDMPTHLHIVGDGDLRAQVEEQVRRLGITNDVTFHGWLDRPAAARVLESSDVLVLPSLRECGGTVVLEAMAMGMPVISTRWGGPASAVLHNETGILVDPTSEELFVDDLAEAMRTLAIDAELRAQMGRAGMARVVSHDYAWTEKIARVLGEMEDLIS